MSRFIHPIFRERLQPFRRAALDSSDRGAQLPASGSKGI
jgi:hypothetical protein